MCFSPSRPWNGPCGWNEISLIAGTELPQPAAGADERAAGAETGDEMRQPSAGLLDDLRRGRVVVRAPVAVVAVLIGIEVAIGILGVTAGAPRGSRRRCSSSGLVRISSAPSARRISLRSALAFSGMHSVTL